MSNAAFMTSELYLIVGAIGAVAVVYAFMKSRLGAGIFQNGNDLSKELTQASSENALLEFIVRNASDGLLIQDVEGHIEWANPAYSRISGYSLEEIKGRKPQEFILAKDVQLTQQEIEEFRYDIDSGQLETLESVRNVRKSGEEFYNQLSFSVARFDDESEPKVVVIARDVTDQVQREQKLAESEERNRELAEVDSLTKLPNRMKLTGFIEELVWSAKRANSNVGLLHIDLDHFKNINDAMGHAAGDWALIKAAEILQNVADKSGMAGRFGGDEFLLVIPHTSDFETLEGIALRILEAMRSPLTWGDNVYVSSCSIGIAMSDVQTTSAAQLIRHADVALYEAKNAGRQNFACFDQEMGAKLNRKLDLSSRIVSAIANGEFEVELQPQYCLTKRQVHGFEALLRWRHPTFGMIYPNEFLPLADQTGSMVLLDETARNCALDSLVKIHDAGAKDVAVSINVSAVTLKNPGFVGQMKQSVRDRGLQNSSVTIEVLETTFLDDGSGNTLSTISELQDAGFNVELDDFGMGYAGLSHLTKVSTQGIKIDRSMIKNILNDEPTFVIVRAVIKLCEELDINVVAEGVETAAQAIRLKGAGCKILQGFGVAKPMSLEDAINWLDDVSVSPVVSELASSDDKFDKLRQQLKQLM